MLPQQPAASTGVPLESASSTLLSPNAIKPLPMLTGADQVAPPSVEEMPHGPSTPLGDPPNVASSAPVGMTASPGMPLGEPPELLLQASACTSGPRCPDGLIATDPTPLAESPQLVFVSNATCRRAVRRPGKTDRRRPVADLRDQLGMQRRGSGCSRGEQPQRQPEQHTPSQSPTPTSTPHHDLLFVGLVTCL